MQKIERVFDVQKLGLILGLAFIGLISISGCVQAQNGSQTFNLEQKRAGIEKDITPGMSVLEAKAIMLAKYAATQSEDKPDAVIYTIQGKPDKAGVYGVLVITIAHDQGKVTSVDFDLGGMGP